MPRLSRIERAERALAASLKGLRSSRALTEALTADGVDVSNLPTVQAVLADLADRASDMLGALRRTVSDIESERCGLSETIVESRVQWLNGHVSIDRINASGFFVYTLWGDDPGSPLYIGMSRSLFGRLGSHMQQASKREAIRTVTLIEYPDERTMRDAERALIDHFRPPWNVNGVTRALLYPEVV